MKRIFVLFLLAAVVLCGCAPEQRVHSVSVNLNGTEQNFTVDTEQCTISDGQYTYTYQVSGSTATVHYPNGASYTETKSGSISYMNSSGSYDPRTYADGEILIGILEDLTPQRRGGNPIVSLLLIGLGAFYVFAPHAAWFLFYGWHYKDAEPSDASLIIARISGVAVILVGLFIMFM